MFAKFAFLSNYNIIGLVTKTNPIQNWFSQCPKPTPHSIERPLFTMPSDTLLQSIVIERWDVTYEKCLNQSRNICSATIVRFFFQTKIVWYVKRKMSFPVMDIFCEIGRYQILDRHDEKELKAKQYLHIMYWPFSKLVTSNDFENNIVPCQN